MSSRRDQYEGVAETYDQMFKLLPYREYAEEFTLHRLLGDLSGRSVLDLACGTGSFTRRLHGWGAARVVGVDISEDMVRVAREYEAQAPLGLEYVVGDGATLEVIGQFDCVVAMFLFGYADSREVLVQMADGAARNLRPGGRFSAEIMHPDLSRTPGYYHKYGIQYFVDHELKDGDEIHFAVGLGDTVTPRLVGFCWTKDTLASVMEEVGFSDLRWVNPELSERGWAQQDEGFWDDYLRQPPTLFFECTKS